MVLMRVPVHGFISVYVIEWDGVGFFICRYCVVSPCVASMRHIQQGLDALVNIDYAKSRNLYMTTLFRIREVIISLRVVVIGV